MSLIRPLVRSVARPIASPVTRAILQAGGGGVAESIGIGATQMQGGQLYQSTLPDNTFPPESFGWELYGDEP